MLLTLMPLAACKPAPLRGGGGPCQSLSDCKPGLVCGSSGRCTRSLADLARQTDAPPFTMFDAAGEAGDAAAGDAGTARDAGSVTKPDAGVADGG